MEDLLNSISSSLRHEQYYGALMIAFMIPSVANALISSTGRDTEKGYIDWYDNNVEGHADINGIDCWKLRCRMLHQGVASPDKRSNEKYSSRYTKFIFCLPDQNIVTGNKYNNPSNKVIDIELIQFCNEVISAGWKWLEKEKDNTLVSSRLSETVRLRPHPMFNFKLVIY